jgi:hypothetical protein
MQAKPNSPTAPTPSSVSVLGSGSASAPDETATDEAALAEPKINVASAPTFKLLPK